MFKIYRKKKEGEDFVIICNKSKYTKVEISLNKGASVSNLIFNNKKIITDLRKKPYEKTFASSIMFPFANRVNFGKYHFLGKKYKLICNEKNKKNALHGLVYNKNFALINRSIKENSGEICLSYKYDGDDLGFPFPFAVNLNYRLTKKKFSVILRITNIGNSVFPFTAGWHPYFEAKDLKKSIIKFNSLEKIESDNRNITTKIIKTKTPCPLILKNKTLDDAYILNKNEIIYKTQDYLVKMSSSEKENYLQLYTPKNKQAIAIEPMTGVSDSFNNGIGLKKLNPKEIYKIKWDLNIITK